TGRNQFPVDRQVASRMDHHTVAKDVAGAAVVEIEIGMLRQVTDGRLIRSRRQFDRQRARNLEPVGTGHIKGARKPHGSGRVVKSQGDEIAPMKGHRPGAPGKTIDAAMEHVLAQEIAIKRMPGPVKDKSAVTNPVGVTTYNG